MSRASPRHGKSRHAAPSGPSQRQLRAGELIRHALVDALREEHLADPALAEVSVTVSEVRMSSDLKHAICFVEPLGAGVTGAETQTVVKALNSAAKLLRGRIGRIIDMKFTPDLKFFHDDSFAHAARIGALFDNPLVQKDLDARPNSDDDGEG